MYTHRLEEYVLRMPVGSNQEEAAQPLDISGEAAALIVEKQLKADKKIDPARVIKHVGFDALNVKKRHKLCVTLTTDLTDLESPKVLAVARGKDAGAAKKCFSRLRPGQGAAAEPHRVDTGRLYGPACNDLLPHNRLVVGRFHVAKQFNDAVDELRKEPRERTRPGCRTPRASTSAR